jgi:hypothetical protein
MPLAVVLNNHARTFAWWFDDPPPPFVTVTCRLNVCVTVFAPDTPLKLVEIVQVLPPATVAEPVWLPAPSVIPVAVAAKPAVLATVKRKRYESDASKAPIAPPAPRLAEMRQRMLAPTATFGTVTSNAGVAVASAIAVVNFWNGVA